MEATKATKSKSGPKQIPIAAIIDARQRNLSNSEIAKLLDCNPSNITRRLEPFKETLNSLPQFKRRRADIFMFFQSEILNYLTADKLKASSAYQLVGMLSLLYDKERLEREMSTEIVTYKDVSGDVKALDGEILALEARIKGDKIIDVEAIK